MSGPLPFLVPLASALLGFWPADGPGPDPKPRADALDVVVPGGERLVRLQIRVEIDGRSVPAAWDRTFDRLYSFYDRDGDGALDVREADRLPPPFAVRQVLWGQFNPLSGLFPASEDWNPAARGKVGRDELGTLYRRAGLGNVLVGVGTPPATAALTDALLKQLDADGDGRVGEPEWRSAVKTLRKLDRNDDELVGPGELVTGVAYPGASGNALAFPPSPDGPSAADGPMPPFLILPVRSSETYWADVVTRGRDHDRDARLDTTEAGLAPDLFGRLDADKDGRLTAQELARWRELEPDAVWPIRLGTEKDGLAASPGGRDRFTLEAGRLHFELRAGEGQLPKAATAARADYVARFVDADTDRDGFLAAGDVAKRDQAGLKQVVDAADRDGDGRLSRAELDAWLDLQGEVAGGHVLLTVLDHGAGLFELLDADRDSSLSVRELRGAWDRVRGAGCLVNGRLDCARLPRHLIATVSRGHPVSAPAVARRAGPSWFRAMDRNGDGDVSRREFVGSEADFRAFDADGDGLIRSDEAAARPPARTD